MTNMQTRIAELGITMTVRAADRNPAMDRDNNRNMTHWRCKLTMDGRTMTLVFSMGSGHNGALPTLADVLDSLASDAVSVDQSQGFIGWAEDLGYDPDSRKAESTWKACQRQTNKLRHLLGAAFTDILYETERQ